MSLIPIENIYYLLCYAWNKLDEKDKVEVRTEEFHELLDLFAKVLIEITRKLLKRGIDKSYMEDEAEIKGIKGKIKISQTIKTNLLFRKNTICLFDELTSNILINRLLVTTLSNLTNYRNLDKSLLKDLFSLRRMLSHIEHIEIKKPLFKKIRYNRNNRFYEFAINICEIIYDNTLPSKEDGKFIFADFFEDERKMNKLFEEFVRNFYKREQSKYNRVGREIINWQFSIPDKSNGKYLPEMETDITLENETDKIIIDTKYYKETMKLYYEKERINSGNLYQLFSYLLNQQSDNLKSQNAVGILLYPTIEKDYDIEYQYEHHKILIKTLNLNTNWRNISIRLKEIINCPLN